MFKYNSGETVEPGDSVRAFMANAWLAGSVNMVIAPKSESAKDYGCPGGGVLLELNWAGKRTFMLETPPGGVLDEDCVFVARRESKRGRKRGRGRS
jgi:hypothetical protein